jgi:hypothetical protein
MTPEELERERLKSAEALDRAVAGGRGEASARPPEDVLGPAVTATPSGNPTKTPESPAWNPPIPPDLGPVNASWRTGAAKPAGAIASLLDGSREKDREAQIRFNSDQVQLDNALVAWAGEHFAATHRHYDAVIGEMQKRMDEIDLRHRELERELIRHVHEMARRIDVVLGEGEKGRVSHEAALRSLRERLRALEEKLRPAAI